MAQYRTIRPSRYGLRLLAGLGAFLALLILLGGIPAALHLLAGNPLHHLPHQLSDIPRGLAQPIDGVAVITGALLWIGWLAWASFALAFLTELVSQIAGWDRKVIGLRVQQRLAGALIAAIISANTAPALASASATAALRPPAAMATVNTPPALAVAVPAAGTENVPPAVDTPRYITHQVGPREALLDVADRYGVPAERIAAANHGVRQPDGEMLQPGQTRIRGGWQLRIPIAAVTNATSTTLTSAVTTDQTSAHLAYHVVHGDWLSGIAARYLGNADRYPEIAEINPQYAGRHNSTGTQVYPDHIEGGWRLRLPAGAYDHGPAAHAEGHTTGSATTPPPTATTPTPAPPTTAPGAPTAAPATTSPTAQADDAPDGVAPAASPSHTAAGPHPTAPAEPQAPHEQSPGIALPSGSWVDLGLATAVAAAVALVWAHRRRRYTRRPPSADLRLGDPDVAPMPPVVSQIRRRLRQAGRRSLDPTDQQDLDLDARPDDILDAGAWPPAVNDSSDLEAGLDLLGQEPHGPDDEADDPDDDGDNSGNGDGYEVDGRAPASRIDRAGDADPGPARPMVPSLAHPLVTVWPPAGLGLTGSGAQAAARGFLAAALAAGGLDAPDERSWVVMPAVTAATLLDADADALPATPRLTVTAAGLDEALDLLEAQTLHRSRIVYDHEVDTVAEVRAADPTEQPLPPILLLADATTRHQRTRVAALLAQGQRLDIHGVLLGAWPNGDTVLVAADGTTSRADRNGSRHGAHPAGIGRLAVLTPVETSDLLVTLAESHTGAPQAPAPVEPAATIAGAAAADPGTGPWPGWAAATDPGAHRADEPAAAESGAPDPARGGDLDAGTPTPAACGSGDGIRVPAAVPASTPAAGVVESGGVRGGDLTAETPVTAATGDGGPGDARAALVATGADTDDEDTEDDDDVPADQAGPGRVQVAVLGRAGILDVPPGPNLRKKSLEMLVYLAVHNGEASAEAILDDLMPDVPASKAPGRLYTYVSDLRTILRRTGGRGTYVTHPDRRYALNHDTVDVDLWRMRAAIRDANLATDPAERITALRRAVGTYAGHLAEGADYEWVEPYREAVRQQALDAHLALADTLADNPAEQVAVLDTAIRHNPYIEELYQRAMRARAALGHLDAIRTLRRALTRALGEIDAEPTDETIALADQLVEQLRRPGRRPDLRPAPRPGETASDGAAA